MRAGKGTNKILYKVIMEYKLGKKGRKKDKMTRQTKNIPILHVYAIYKKYVQPDDLHTYFGNHYNQHQKEICTLCCIITCD